MSWSTSELRVRLALWNRFKPSSKIFYWPLQGGTSFVDLLCFFCLVFAMPLYTSVYMCLVVTCWEGLPSWLSFVVSYCEFVTFPLVSLVRCGTWLYRFLIFAPLLTLQYPGWWLPIVLHRIIIYESHVVWLSGYCSYQNTAWCCCKWCVQAVYMLLR